MPELECFDAVHTRARCCTGFPKAMVQLYQVMPHPQVWIEGPCFAAQPRKIYGCAETRGRLVACERWEGRFALIPEVLRALDANKVLISWSSPNYDHCEEGAVVNSAMKATVVAYATGGRCISVDLVELPFEL